jgi:hypothetical protein
VSLGYDPDGKRVARKVSGRITQEVKDKLPEFDSDIQAGIQRSAGRYTVSDASKTGCAKAWTAAPRRPSGSTGTSCSRSFTASARSRSGLDHPAHPQGPHGDRSDALQRTIVLTHKRAGAGDPARRANDNVRRNVAALVCPPTGQDSTCVGNVGSPSHR